MPAKVILDIITGDKVSQIQGQSEVTGPAADVIIVNPNGFILKNSTFINVKSLTLVSGWLNHKDNHTISISVNPSSKIIVKGNIESLNTNLNLIAGTISITNALISEKAIKILATCGVASYKRRDWSITGLLKAVPKNKPAIMVSKRATVDADEVKFTTFDKGDDIILCGTITSKRHDIIIDSAWDVNIIGGTINSCRDLVISAANSLMVN